MKLRYLLLFTILSRIVVAQPSGDAVFDKDQTNSRNFYRQDGKIGLQKAGYKPVTKPIYDTLYAAGNDRFAALLYSTTAQQALWGIINAKGEVILPLKFRKLSIQYDLAVVGLQEKNKIRYGVYALTDGAEIISPVYESIKVLNEDYLTIQKGNKIMILTHSGVKTTELPADSLSMLTNTYAKYYLNGKVGVFNIPQNIAEPPVYADIKIDDTALMARLLPRWTIYRKYDTLVYNYHNLQEWNANLIVTASGKMWVIDEKNKKVSAVYDEITVSSKELAFVKLHDKWGVINNFGKEIITPAYKEVSLDEEMIYAKGFGESRWQIFDHYGYLKSKHVYDSVLAISQGRIAIKRHGKWGFLNRFGVEIISPIFDSVKPFRNDLSVVTFYGEDGIIDRQGNWVSPPRKLTIIDYGHGTILARVNRQYQVRSITDGELIYFTGNRLEMQADGFTETDSSGLVIRHIAWNGTFADHDDTYATTMAGGGGLVIFRENNKYGFKDQQGRIVIANRYDEAKPFHQRMAAIRIHEKWGFINLDERIIVQPGYDSVGNFSGNLCVVKNRGLLGVVNLKGQVVVPTEYQHIDLMSNGKLRVQKNNLWGILHENGSIAIPVKYTQLIRINQATYIVQRRGKYGTISNSGVSIMPLIYDYITYSATSNSLITKKRPDNEWTFVRNIHPL